jgi:hypothetical protein
MYINKLEKFLIEATLLDRTNDTTIDISSFIRSVNIKKEFISNSFPLFVIDIMTTQQIRDIMRDNDISINLKIDKYSDSDSELSEDSNEIPIIEERIVDTNIRIYNKPYMSSSNYKEEDDENSDGMSDVMRVFPYQLSGIPDELVAKNDKIVNEVYDNAKINDVLVHLISQVEDNEIYIDNSDNSERFRSLLIPPLNIIPALRYLQNIYGVYNSSLGIFFDLNKTYVYKIFNKDRQNTNTVEIITIPANDISDDNKLLTPMVDENNNIRIHLKNTPDFTSFTKINNDVIGKKTVFNSYDYNFDVIKRIIDNAEVEGNKTRYYWNTQQDKLFEDMFINENKEISESINISLSNIDPNYFNIDTLYKLSTQTEYANGDYSLIEKSFSIYTNDYEHYNLAINLKLIKIR